MELRFTPEHKNINELFGRDIKYIIPEYQRPYSWDCLGKSDKNNQVNVMWSDLVEYFEHDERNTYFFGSMVLIGNGNQEYQVIDGQQRLTTIVLLFSAIKCFLQEVKPSISQDNLKSFADTIISFIDDVLYNKKFFGAATVEKKLKIAKNTDFDYDKVLAYVIECNRIDPQELRNATVEQRIVANRYFNNRDFFIERLRDVFLEHQSFTEAKATKLNDFIEFLKSRVSVVRILTPTFEIAYHIFEILNNRGLPLSNKDLFRNLLIKEWDALKNSNSSYSHINPSDLWNELDNNYEFQDDFIGRWVESYKAAKQQYSAFNDMKDIYDREYRDKLPEKKIELFYSDIKRDLGYYTTIINNSFNDRHIQGKINFILNGSNYRYSMNFLLALVKCFDGKEDPHFTEVLTAFERYLVYCLLCTRFSYAPVNAAIGSLNNKNWADAISKLNAATADDEILVALRENFYDNETPKLLLAKIVWIEQANTADDVVTQSLNYDKCSLEHIIPQSVAGTSWEKYSRKFLDEYTYKLGNMTLLTSKINSTAKNQSFEIKKKHYERTKLPMTISLAAVDTLTPDYISQRQDDFIAILRKDLNLGRT
jgi:uncharacterized protein with ParB-like and HNH nuclease domain